MSAADTSLPGIQVLCPTRWTVQADSLASVTKNYAILQSTWEEALEISKDSETKACIQGVASQMYTFKFLFGTMLAEMVLKHPDNLSHTLQHKSMSAAAGQRIAQMTVQTLQSVQNDETFHLFWEKCLCLQTLWKWMSHNCLIIAKGLIDMKKVLQQEAFQAVLRISIASSTLKLLIWLLHMSKTDLIDQATRYTSKQKS